MATLDAVISDITKWNGSAKSLMRMRQQLGITDPGVSTDSVLRKKLDELARLRGGSDTQPPDSSDVLPPTSSGSGGTTVTGNFTGRSKDVDSMWHKAFEDDFPYKASEGGFLGTYSKWDAYPTNYLTTAGQRDGSMKGDHYGVKNISVKDVGGTQAMVCRLLPKNMTDDGKNWGAAPYPRFDVGHGQARCPSMKVEMRVRIPNQVPGWHPANLLWFDNESWPGGGEDDFWEQSTPGNIGAFFHNAGATAGGDQRHFDTKTSPADWHVIGFEHVAGKSYKMFIDGKQVKPDDGGDDAAGTITKRVPHGVARLVLQNEPDGTPNKDMEIQYDWICVWTA